MIGLVGINHKTAPLEIREKLALSRDDITTVSDKIRNSSKGESIMVSTCNRTEAYIDFDRPIRESDLDQIRGILCDGRFIDGLSTDHFYNLIDRQAVTHLLRVVSGLDSMVLGENQILGQVKEAYGAAAGSIGSTALNRLFHLAFRVGKRVRAETGINEGASSLSYAAVELASTIFELVEHPIALVGAGKNGKLVVESLANRGCRNISVVNRSPERTWLMERDFGAKTIGLENLESVLVQSDIVIFSTGAQEPILVGERLEPILKNRKGRPLVIIDLAVPRDVGEDVGLLDSVHLYDIDDLGDVVSRNLEVREAEVEQAEGIIAEETDRFFEWLRSLNLSQTIKKLNSGIDSIGFEELGRLKGQLPEEEFIRIEDLVSRLKEKSRRLLIGRLRALTENGQRLDYIELADRLFDFGIDNRQ